MISVEVPNEYKIFIIHYLDIQRLLWWRIRCVKPNCRYQMRIKYMMKDFWDSFSVQSKIMKNAYPRIRSLQANVLLLYFLRTRWVFHSQKIYIYGGILVDAKCETTKCGYSPEENRKHSNEDLFAFWATHLCIAMLPVSAIEMRIICSKNIPPYLCFVFVFLRSAIITLNNLIMIIRSSFPT